VGHESKEAILTQLKEMEWGNTSALNKQKVTDLLTTVARNDITALPNPQVEPHQSLITELTAGNDIGDIAKRIVNDETDDKWLARARKNLANGCPFTSHLVWNQLHQGSDLSLADCFRLELTLSCNCAVRGDFAEGIRALLIDKDKSPKWQHSSVAEVPVEEVDAFFLPPWGERTHPLADLDK
jgi:hypothetical protein